MKKELTQAQLGRIPSYLQVLMDFKNKGLEYVSSNDLADALDLNFEMVRKDIAAISSKEGIPNKGRKVVELIEDIEKVCGHDQNHNALLVGIGSLGRALLNYNGFEHYGLNIVAAFDNKQTHVGEKINGVPIYHFDDLKDVKRLYNASIGIICVQKEKAQGVAIHLVASGIEAIWNFAPIKLDLNDEVIVSNMDMAESLAKLAHRLYRKVTKKGE